MTEGKRRRPQKAFTRKDFRYKRDWRLAKENERENDGEFSPEGFYVLMYLAFSAMSITMGHSYDLEQLTNELYFIFPGLAVNLIGVILFEAKDGKYSKIGHILAFISIIFIASKVFFFW